MHDIFLPVVLLLLWHCIQDQRCGYNDIDIGLHFHCFEAIINITYGLYDMASLPDPQELFQ